MIKINLTVVFLNEGDALLQAFGIIKTYHKLFAAAPIPPKAFRVPIAVLGWTVDLPAADVHHQHPGLTAFPCWLEDAHDIPDIRPGCFTIAYSQQPVFDSGLRQMIVFSISPRKIEAAHAAASHKYPCHQFCVSGNPNPQGIPGCGNAHNAHCHKEITA